MDDIQMLRKKNAELAEEIQDYNEDVREQRKKQDEAAHRNAEERNKIFDKICQIGGKTTKGLERKGWRN